MSRSDVRAHRHRIALGAVILLALVAGWRVLALAMAEYLADTNPERALQWRADYPRALLKLSEQRLIQGKLDESEALARRLLAADPLDGRAYRVLGNVAGLRGDRERQFAMMALAARHAPRDIPARAWAAQIALQRHDAAAAVRHYDRMLRVSSGAHPELLEMLVGLASIPEGRVALVETLATAPPWRTEYLGILAYRCPDPVDLAEIFSGLRAKGSLSPVESALYLGRLVKDQLWDEAFVAWAGGLSPQQLADVTAPMNGGFENPSPASGPFDWTIARRAGVDATIQPLPDGSGHALRVEFEGRRSDFRDVRQLLLLPAAQGYRLEWRSRFDDLETPRGLRWTVTCASGPAGRVLATEPQAGTHPWHASDVSFDVPENCPAQWLALEIDARIAAETQARGTAWFDDVRVISPARATR